MRVPLTAVAVSVPGADGGTVSVVPPPPARNALTTAPPASAALNVDPADTGPAAAWRWSSVTSFVLGEAGTRSLITYPLPAVNVTPFRAEIRPTTKSPLAVVVVAPLFGVVPVPCADAVPSSEFAAATPAYSRIANRRVPPPIVSDTVTVFAPPAMFSA